MEKEEEVGKSEGRAFIKKPALFRTFGLTNFLPLLN
jgi:hypothetical protein